MQILFMHSLQELHRETLQTFRAMFSVGFMKGGKESKELCSVFGLGLRLNGQFSRNFVYCCMHVWSCLPSPSALRRREEKSSASTILTRETS